MDDCGEGAHFDHADPDPGCDFMEALHDGGGDEGDGEVPALPIPDGKHREVLASVWGGHVGAAGEDVVYGVVVTPEPNLVLLGTGGQHGKQTGGGLSVRHEAVDKTGVDGGEEIGLPGVQVGRSGSGLKGGLHLLEGLEVFLGEGPAADFVADRDYLFESHRRGHRAGDQFEVLDAFDKELGKELRASGFRSGRG